MWTGWVTEGEWREWGILGKEIGYVAYYWLKGQGKLTVINIAMASCSSLFFYWLQLIRREIIVPVKCQPLTPAQCSGRAGLWFAHKARGPWTFSDSHLYVERLFWVS